MHTDAPDHVIMRSLAQEIALGGDVDLWAKKMTVSAEVAREWTLLPEFREVVEKCRLAHAERMVGKIARCAERAIDRLRAKGIGVLDSVEIYKGGPAA